MNSIFSIFVQPDDRKPSARSDKTPVPAPQPTPSGGQPVVVGSLSGSAAPAAPREDPQVRAQLEKAMLSDGDNSVGKFREAVASLAEDIPDMATRIKVAFKTLRGSGLTPEAVIADLASDERILANKQREFREFIAGKRQSGLGSKQTEMDTITATIAQKQEAIEQLKREIAELTAKQSQLETAARTEAQRFADVEAGFNATLAAIRAERQQMLSLVQPFCTNK